MSRGQGPNSLICKNKDQIKAMKTSQFTLEGFCQGAFPVEGISDIAHEEWYQQAINCVKKERHEEALQIAEAHFSAEYCTDNISKFTDNQIKFIKTTSTNLSQPFIEIDGEQEILLFKWIGAHFLMEAPEELVNEWREASENGNQTLSLDKLNHWLGDDEPLQDGCIYSLGACWYDLEGMGENGCRILDQNT